MNVMNIWKSATFMPYATESKGRMNVVNVARKYFVSRARELPTPNRGSALRQQGELGEHGEHAKSDKFTA